MQIDIDKKSGIPIYIQVKNQIMDEIKNGNVKIGEKMPTERELSQTLKTSRNTVSSAYNLLEQEGVLISYQGRGTFVAEEAKTWKQYTNKDKLYKIIDLGLEEALEMGLNPKEFFALVRERIKEKEELLKKVNAVFIECNIEQSREFSKQLSSTTGLDVVPLVVSDLENRSEKTGRILKETQLIIATFNHVNEVKNLTAGFNKEVYGVAINPSLETIVRIAKFPSDTKFGLVCLSKEFQFKIESALRSAGLENIILNKTISRKREDVQKVVSDSDVIIVSPGRFDEVKKAAGDNKEVISFVYNLDEDSVKDIMSKLIDIKNQI
jgi:GntR family transcriptional regulator